MSLPCQVVAVLTLQALALVAGENDWVIVPGKRVGPITRTSTHADLIHSFGAKSVVDGDVTVSEQGPEPGTTVLGDDPEHSLTIIWNDDDGHVASITFCQHSTKCRWHTEDGITLGTTLKALERMNGRPFQLYGFGWDYGGTVVSWENGRLERLQLGTCGGLGLSLEPVDERKPEKQTLIDEVQGDVEFPSSNRAMQALDVRVSSMNLTFGPGEGCANVVSLWQPARSETASAKASR